MKPHSLSRLQALIAVGLLFGLVAVGLIVGTWPGPLDNDGAPARESTLRPELFEFYSPSLDREMPVKVFLPPGYESGEQRYPVLYMLHGRAPTEDENYEWEVYGIFDRAWELMSRGEIQPFIVVLPQGGRSYWVDHADGLPWGQYLARDVVNVIDNEYRTLQDAGQRAVGGLSMGADGAVQVALNYPGTFGVVGVHSPVLRPFEEVDAFYGDRDYFEWHYPVTLVERYTDRARDLILELDSGDDDLWLSVTEAFHAQLASLEIPHVWNRWPGPHNGDYWTLHVDDYLRFYGEAFDRGLDARSTQDAP